MTLPYRLLVSLNVSVSKVFARDSLAACALLVSYLKMLCLCVHACVHVCVHVCICVWGFPRENLGFESIESS